MSDKEYPKNLIIAKGFITPQISFNDTPPERIMISFS